ncbi:hypothetical protein [Litchfieldia alkalitelluris]|uniref:hypothetical protein n=1 Tax=Litchfieldia alkalitelluris TaxID=304268 RepID=UPI00099785CB|nr:hypothetical protein [Litchfieldia alkalitelluris]
MRITIQRILVRVKKFIVIIVIMPILLGLLGWLIPVENNPVTYKAEAKILLGEYSHSDLNNPKHLQILLTHELFYKERLNDWWENHQNQIKANFQVMIVDEGVIVLSYHDQSAERAERFLHDVLEEYLLLDQSVVAEKKTVIQSAIDSISNLEISKEESVEHQQFLYELNTELLSVREAKLLNNMELRSESIKSLTSSERGFLGGLIGITLAWLWVVVPVGFQKKEGSF